MSTTATHGIRLSVRLEGAERESGSGWNEVARLRAVVGTCWSLAPSPEKLSCWYVDEIKVKGEVIASGISVDIREGRLKGMVVAVKTIRTPREMSEIDVIHEVCNMARCSVRCELIGMAIEPRPSAGNASFG